MTTRRYVEVDVFTAEPYRGNPLAVVIDGDGLSTEAMQRFANWTNLSETTFLLPPTSPGADYHVRIFTTTMELPFAGHPTLGSCHAWLKAGGVPKRSGVIVQQCGIGLVTVRLDAADRLAFAAPSMLRHSPVDASTMNEAIAALGIDRSAVVDSAWIDNGPGWLGILLGSADAALAITPTDTSLKLGVFGAHPPDSEFAYEVRGFFPIDGRTVEDPVTGSLNASGAQWLIGGGRFTPPYTASQGTALGRAGRIHISTDDTGQVWVAGDAVTCITGTVEL
jgi:PhzF family phenazine biosynthesis protein